MATISTELREALSAIDITVDDKDVLLSDNARVTATTVYTSPTQLEAAAEQYRLVTGDSLSPEDLESGLDWEE